MTAPCKGVLVKDATVGSLGGLSIGVGNLGRGADGRLEAVVSAWKPGAADDDPGRYRGLVHEGDTFEAGGVTVRVLALQDGAQGDLPGSSERAACLELVR